MDLKALIIGGDKRQEYLKTFLEANFGEVIHIRRPVDLWALDEIEEYSHIVLPLPVSKDKRHICSSDNLGLEIQDVVCRIKPCHKVFGSGFDNMTMDFFEDKQIEYCDFMKDKIFKRANALLTAQGALKLMLDNTDDYIISKKALIIGFGDVGETLAEKLKNNGLDVYITARNKRKLSLAGLYGYKTIGFSSFKSCIYLFDYVFGTVPAKILDTEDIKNLKADCSYMELASYPFTANEEDFRLFEIKYLNGSALPGRYLPMASGKLLADYILNNL